MKGSANLFIKNQMRDKASIVQALIFQNTFSQRTLVQGDINDPNIIINSSVNG